MKHFSSSIQHILAELERIDLLLQVHICQIRQTQTVDPAFRGLYLSDDQIDQLLAKPIGQPHWVSAPNPLKVKDILGSLKVLRESITQKKILV